VADDERTTGFLKMIADLDERYLVGGRDVREVWLIRHADAYRGLEALEAGRIDPPVSPRGHDQAARLASRLARVPLDAVWSSDLLRARQTAEVLAHDRPLEVRVDHRLGEVRTHWDADGGTHVPSPPGTYPFPEPMADVVARMRSVVLDILAGLAASPGPRPRAAAVTHNAAIAIFVASLLGLEWGQLKVMPQFTSVTVLAARGDQMVVQSIADATHLATSTAED
jgi:broad specificity phosphatase PhoE